MTSTCMPGWHTLFPLSVSAPRPEEPSSRGLSQICGNQHYGQQPPPPGRTWVWPRSGSWQPSPGGTAGSSGSWSWQPGCGPGKISSILWRCHRKYSLINKSFEDKGRPAGLRRSDKMLVFHFDSLPPSLSWRSQSWNNDGQHDGGEGDGVHDEEEGDDGEPGKPRDAPKVLLDLLAHLKPKALLSASAKLTSISNHYQHCQ